MIDLDKNPIIAIDFDGTVVRHEFPAIGASIGAEPWLRQWVEAGAKLILFTMRDQEYLQAAREWFEHHDIELWCVQRNPQQAAWTCSSKPYAKLYIDDHGFGIPLAYPETGRPFVDWAVVGPQVLGALQKGTS